MIIHLQYFTESTSSGTFAVNTDAAFMGIMRQLLVSPATASTTYNLTITDSDDLDIYCDTSITGNYAPEVAIPVRGVYTVTIDSATADESFTIKLMVEE